MSSQPLVSIALCTYNGAAYLPAQLDTLVNQSYPNIEIIAVDDLSTDDTMAILNHYAEKYASIKIYQNEHNLGYVGNYYKAMQLANGDYIALADQDDIWEPNKIAIMVASIGNNILLYHDSAFISEDGSPIGRNMSDIRNFYQGGDSRVFLFENCVSGHAALFKRELLNKITGFTPPVIHDWWLAYIALNEGTIDYIPQVLVQYRQHRKASTNILRQERGEVHKGRSLQKIEYQLSVTRALLSYTNNKETAFKERLLSLMEKRMRSYFSFSLAWFVYKNRGILLFIQKKPAFSKLNFIIKMVWGYRLKKLFN